MKAFLAAVVAFPVAFLLLAIPMMGNDAPASAADCSPTGGAPLQALAGAVGAWNGFTTEQLSNAATIVKVGASKNVPPRGQQIALMTAIDESGLRNLDHGDRDSLGLFQQRPSMGWGMPTQLLDPVYTASAFYDRLLTVNGWEAMSPATQAAHAVQRNADPNVYQQFWDDAGAILSHLTGGGPTSTASGPGGTTSPSLAGVTPVAAPVVSYCDSHDVGGSGFAVNAVAPYVGPYDPAQLTARTQQFAADSGGWYRMCQSFVAQLAGRPASGFASAASAMASFRAAGVFHDVNAVDGYAPPIGAWLYYSNNGNPYGHVVTYLGDGIVAGTDTWRKDHVDSGPASDITDGRWHLTYEGWAVPWATDATDVPVKAPLAASQPTTRTSP